MKRKCLVGVLFLAVVLVTNVIIFTALAQGDDVCNMDCIDYNMLHLHKTHLSGFALFERTKIL